MQNRLSIIPLVLGLIVLTLSLSLSVWQVANPTPRQTFKTRAGEEPITVSLFPQGGTFRVSGTSNKDMTVGVILESNNKPVRDIDVTITFNPDLATVSGFTPGMLFDKYLTTAVDNYVGVIAVSAVNSTPRSVTGIVGSFKFRPKTPGTLNFSFSRAGGTGKSVGATYILE